MTSKTEYKPFFSHEKLDVYVLTLEFLAFCDALYRSWPRGRG